MEDRRRTAAPAPGTSPAPPRPATGAAPATLRVFRTALLALVALGGMIPAPPPLAAQSGIGPALGSVVPPATVQDLDGNEVQLRDVIGDRPALIQFWAAWCPQCEELQPQLDRIQREYGDRLQIVAVGVAVNQNPRRIRRHLERHDPGYPYLYDAGGEAVRAYGAATTSIVVLLDAEGRVAYTGVGPDQDLLAAVRELLEEGRPPGPTAPGPPSRPPA